MAVRDLDDLKKEAISDRARDHAEIEEYAITCDGYRVVLRNPSAIPGEEADNVQPGLANQFRLLCQSKKDFKVLWKKIGQWEQEDLRWLVGNIIEHYENEEQGKGASSTS